MPETLEYTNTALFHREKRLDIGFQRMIAPFFHAEPGDEFPPVRQWYWGILMAPKVAEELSKHGLPKYTRSDAMELVRFGLDIWETRNANLWDPPSEDAAIIREVLPMAIRKFSSSAEYERYLFGASSRWLESRLSMAEAMVRNTMLNTLWLNPLSAFAISQTTRNVYRRHADGNYKLHPVKQRRRNS